MSWDFSGDASAVQRAIDDAKLDADEVALTASGNVLVGVAPKGFDAWSWLDEELHEALAGVVKSLTLRDAKPQPAGRALWTTRSGTGGRRRGPAERRAGAAC